MTSNKKEIAKLIAGRMKSVAKASSYRELGEIFGGVTSQAISGAISKGKIPDRWFDVMEEKYGVTREELCRPPDKPVVDLPSMPYSDASDDEEREHCIKEMNLLFHQIMRWLEDERGLDSLTSRDFINTFHERFPEIGEWIKKRKGKGNQALPQKSISDGTHGK